MNAPLAPDVFFRPLRYAEATHVTDNGFTRTRVIESVPGWLARDYAAGKLKPDSHGFGVVTKLLTALTPRDWATALDILMGCDDPEAMEYALGKLASLQDCTWWCCVNAMLRTETLGEENSPTQRGLIQKGYDLAWHWREQLLCAEALSVIRAPLEEVQAAIELAREKGGEPSRIEIDARSPFILMCNLPRGIMRIHFEYPFVGPAIL